MSILNLLLYPTNVYIVDYKMYVKSMSFVLLLILQVLYGVHICPLQEDLCH